mmetsp:Transcript_24893/g.70062  ORF Transcript_24893/g.70062 Transcript_24893/m.70062 type:complete len:208 (+) Transcript_24893:949-1572(+)
MPPPGKTTPLSTGWPWSMSITHAPRAPAAAPWAARRSQSLTCPSRPAETQVSGPRRAGARDFMQSSWPSIVCTSSPVATSHTLNFPSRPPVAARALSKAAKFAHVTASLCPWNRRRTFLVSDWITAHEPPASPANSRRPSFRHAAHCVKSLNFEMTESASKPPSFPCLHRLIFVPLTAAMRCGAAGQKERPTTGLASVCLPQVLKAL